VSGGLRTLRLPSGGEVFWAASADKGLGLALYQPGSLAGRCYKAAWSALGGRSPSFELTRILGSRRDQLPGWRAGYLSPAGHWQKLLLVCRSEGGLYLRKFPVARGSMARCSNERAALAQLAKYSQLGGLVPALIHLPTVVGSDADCLAMDYFEPSSNKQLRAEELLELLVRLRTVDARVVNIERVVSLEEASAFLQHTNGLSKEWAARLQSLLDSVRSKSPAHVKTCLAHRDLAPWNLVRDKNGGLHVIDWEYAAPGREAHHDELGFLFLQEVGRGRSPDDTARSFLAKADGLGLPGAAVEFFLLDTSVQYLTFFFEGGDIHEGKVLRTLAIAGGALAS
jgi:hypothetical protein